MSKLPLSGSIGGKVDVKGKAKQPLFDCALTGNQLGFKDITIGNLSLNAASDPSGMVQVSKLMLENKGSRLEAQGNIQVFQENSMAVHPELPLDVSLLLKHVKPKDFLSKLPLSGSLGGKVAVKGRVRQPIFDCALKGNHLGFKDITIGNLSLKAASDASGMVRVSNLDLNNQGSALQAKGTVQVFQKDSMAIHPSLPLNLSLLLRDIELKDFFAKDKVPAGGSVEGKLTVKGNIRQPVFDCKLKGNQVHFRNITIGNLNINAMSDPSGVVRISALNLENQGSVLQGKGTVQVFQKDSLAVNASFPLNLSLRLRGIEPKDFLKKAPVSVTVGGKLDIRGNLNALDADLSLDAKSLKFADKVQANTISLTGNVKGSVKHPKGTVQLIGKNFNFGVQKIKEIRTDARVDGKTIGIDLLQVTVAPQQSINASGKVDLDKKSYQLKLWSKGIDLDHIDKVREQKIAKGNIRLDLSGAGTFDNPRVAGDIALRNLRLKGKPVDDFQIRLTLKDQLARISGVLNFDLDGSFHLKRKDFSGSLRFDKTDLGPYFKLAGQTDLSGNLTGKIKARGNPGAVEGIQADADFSDLSLFFKEKEMAHSQDFKASFRNGEISLPGSRIRILKKGGLTLSGSGKPKGPFDFQAKGAIPLGLVSEFTDAVSDATGEVALSVHLTGSLPQPDIRADIELKKIGMTITALLQQLHDLNGRIQITPTSAKIQDIKGQLDNGRIHLNGGADLRGFQPTRVDVTLKAESLPLNVPHTLEMLMNADLRVRGTPATSAVTGEAVILEGTYHKDVELSLISGLKSAMQKRRETAPKSSKPRNPFLENMSLDISLKRRNPFVVDNNLALLDINPDLRINGTASRPLISGRANIDTGTMTYQKKKFEVKKGVIDFLNPYKIEPTLDIESEIELREWLITLKVSGTPDALDFKLTSDPPEEHGDILSLLVLGKATREIGRSEGGTTKLPAQMIADIVESTMGEDIRKATGLDILKVEFQDDEGASDSDKVKVTLGKELSRRMTVKYAMESKNGEMVQKGIAEYKFLENMILTGFQDSKGTFGGELRFRLEFR